MSDKAGKQAFTVTLQPTAVIDPALFALKHAGGAILVSLKAIDQTDLTGPVAITGPSMSFQFDSAVEDDGPRKNAYRAWLLAKGFQDLARGLRESLKAANVWISILDLHGKSIPDEGFDALQSKLSDSADRLKFPQLMESVNKGKRPVSPPLRCTL